MSPRKKKSLFGRIFLKEINYEDGTRKVRVNLLTIILVMLTTGMIACALLSGWNCAGCEKKPLNIKDVRGSAK